MDRWESIKDFPQYEINLDGYIRDKKTKRLKSTRTNAGGDVIVDLHRDNRRHTRKVTLLVANTYFDEPVSDAFNSVIQLNGDKRDCSLKNLRRRPRWFVVEYNRMFNDDPILVPVVVVDTGEIFETLREACVHYGWIERSAYVSLCGGDPVFPHHYTLQMPNTY